MTLRRCLACTRSGKPSARKQVLKCVVKLVVVTLVVKSIPDASLLSICLSLTLSHSPSLYLALSRQARHMAKRRVGVYQSPSYAGARAPRGGVTDRASCLPTFSHFLIVNKTSLTHSLSLSLPDTALHLKQSEVVDSRRSMRSMCSSC